MPNCRMEGRKRDLALFNLAIDSKLRGCDVVAVRVDDVAPSGYAIDRATIRQKKTGRPVRFELTDQTRLAIDEYLRLTGRQVKFCSLAEARARAGLPPGSMRDSCTRLGGRIGLDPAKFGTTLIVTNEGSADLPAHWQSARRPAFAGAYKDRKHRQVSRQSRSMTR